MIAIVDEECRIVNANQAMFKTFGEDIIHKNICDILRIPCKMKDNKAPFTKEVSRILHTNDRTYSFKAYPFTEGMKGHILVIRDITKEYELEKRALQAEKLAALGQMTACIAHEINNPLTGIVGYAEMLMTKPLDNVTVKGIQNIYNAALRIKRVVEDMLSFAKTSNLKRSLVSLDKLIDECFEQLDELFVKHNIRIIKNYSDLPLLNLDGELIKVVFINILRNAVQALKGSNIGDTIMVQTWEKDNYISIKIADNGPGIPADIKHKIFDPFFTTKEGSKGVGLGLWMCYNFIKAHHGDISVESTPGQGTAFYIRLPIE